MRRISLTISFMVVLSVVMVSSVSAQSGWEGILMEFASQSGVMDGAANFVGNNLNAAGDRLSNFIRGHESVKVDSLKVDTYTRTGDNTALLGSIQVGDVHLRNVEAGNVTIDTYTRTGDDMALLGTISVGNVDLQNLESDGKVEIDTYTRTGDNTAILGSISVGNVTTE